MKGPQFAMLIIQTPQISYAELSQLLMGAMAIAVALFAIAIAVVGSIFGFLGYRSIQKAAIDAADKAAGEKLQQYFEGQALPEKIQEAIRKRIAEEADLIVTSLMPSIAYSTAPDEGAGRRLANDYPHE